MRASSWCSQSSMPRSSHQPRKRSKASSAVHQGSGSSPSAGSHQLWRKRAERAVLAGAAGAGGKRAGRRPGGGSGGCVCSVCCVGHGNDALRFHVGCVVRGVLHQLWQMVGGTPWSGRSGEVAFGRFVPSWRSEARLFINRAPSWQPSWRGQAIRSTFGNIFFAFRPLSRNCVPQSCGFVETGRACRYGLEKIFPKWNELPGAWRGVPAQGSLCMSSGYAPVRFAGDCAG